MEAQDVDLNRERSLQQRIDELMNDNLRLLHELDVLRRFRDMAYRDPLTGLLGMSILFRLMCPCVRVPC